MGADSKAIARAAAVVSGNGTIERGPGRAGLRVADPRSATRGWRIRCAAPSADAEAIRAAAEAIGPDLEPLGDVHGSAEYRRAMARVTAERAVTPGNGKGGAPWLTQAPSRRSSSRSTARSITATVESRQLLVHFIRDTLAMKGTHIGCDTGSCGACSIIYNGKLIKCCMMLAPPGRRGARSRRSRAWPETAS